MSGLSQLTAVGAQSEFLSGNPEISFWKSSFKRFSNFSQQVEEVTMDGNPANNNMTGIRIPKKGDMLSFIYLSAIDGTSGNASIDWSTVIDHVDVLVGGSKVDTLDFNFTSNISPQTQAPQVSRSNVGPFQGSGGGSSFIYPLKFWFAENWSSALPLCALQYSEVELHIFWGTNITAGATRFQCHANYVFLDEDEREHVSSTPADHIMTQVQKLTVNANAGMKRVPLNFTHPCKYIASTAGNLCTTGGGTLAEDNLVKLIINGNDIGKPRNAVPHFREVPQYYNSPNWTVTNGNDLFVYSFCLDTSKNQPTGALNFSRVDNCELNSTTDVTGDLYAVVYNIFRVQNGLGATLFAN